jgi:hypothetical protein
MVMLGLKKKGYKRNNCFPNKLFLIHCYAHIVKLKSKRKTED